MLGLSGEKGRKFQLGMIGVGVCILLAVADALLRKLAGIDLGTTFQWAIGSVAALTGIAGVAIAVDDAAHAREKEGKKKTTK